MKTTLGGRYAILSENGDIIGCDLFTWADSSENGYRLIKQEDLANGYWISTVFLGLDHNYSLNGPPRWFETMIFSYGPPYAAILCGRYSTLQEALEGHAKAKREFNNGS